MCLIVDANVATLVFSPPPHADFKPVAEALRAKTATAVYGGQLVDEYEKLSSLTRIIRELDRQGILRLQSHAKVEAMTRSVKDEGLCVSDDQHIIALARVADVRLLCSGDKNLHRDFTNPAILKPRGDIYQKASHAHLIAKHCSKAKKARSKR